MLHIHRVFVHWIDNKDRCIGGDSLGIVRGKGEQDRLDDGQRYFWCGFFLVISDNPLKLTHPRVDPSRLRRVDDQAQVDLSS